MKLKRLLLAVALIFSLVAAACGSDDDTTETSDDGDTATTAAPDDGGEAMADFDRELNVAYFAEWPTPNQFGQADGSFAAAVGVDSINWIPLATGGEMSEGMISGDVDIAYSQGLTPFAGAINNGADFKLVGIAVAYAEADNCIAQGSLGITRENAAEVLDGKTIMTPFGNVTHYKMLTMLQFLNVDLDSVNFLQAESGATTAAAFENGDIDVGCAFGGSIVQMQDNGGVTIMTGAEQETEIGNYTFDIVSIPTSFGEEHPDVVSNFLKATDEFNDGWRADPDTYNPVVALAAGMTDVGNFLGGDLWFSFPTIAEQLSDGPEAWKGGNVANAMQEQVETLASLADGSPATGDFAGSVDTSYLEAAK